MLLHKCDVHVLCTNITHRHCLPTTPILRAHTNFKHTYQNRKKKVEFHPNHKPLSPLLWPDSLTSLAGENWYTSVMSLVPVKQLSPPFYCLPLLLNLAMEEYYTSLKHLAPAKPLSPLLLVRSSIKPSRGKYNTFASLKKAIPNHQTLFANNTCKLFADRTQTLLLECLQSLLSRPQLFPGCLWVRKLVQQPQHFTKKMDSVKNKRKIKRR